MTWDRIDRRAVRLRATRFGETDFASASDSPAWTKLGAKRRAKSGGEAGIRTLGTTLRSYNGLANRRLRPLGHLTALSELFSHKHFPISGFLKRAWFLLDCA